MPMDQPGMMLSRGDREHARITRGRNRSTNLKRTRYK